MFLLFLGKESLLPMVQSYILLELEFSAGLAFPPLYFYNGGVKEFLATVKQHVVLVRWVIFNCLLCPALLNFCDKNILLVWFLSYGEYEGLQHSIGSCNDAMKMVSC